MNMKEPWENDSCEQVRALYQSYTVPQAAMLWCGVPSKEVDHHLKFAKPTSEASSYGQHVLKHPYIPCLEARCRAIHDAIINNELKVGRDGGNTFFIKEQHIAFPRRTVKSVDLKEWIASKFSDEKPVFLFSEIERNTHPAINAESFRALQVDLIAKTTALENMTKNLENTTKKLDAVLGERDSLAGMVDGYIEKLKKRDAPTERAETTYQNTIGGLLQVMLGKSPSGISHSVFRKQTDIINALLAHHGNKPGITQRTLEEKFAAANRSLSES
jgi:hypothetical protein